MDYTKQNSENLHGLNLQLISSDNEFINFPRLSIASTPILNLDRPSTEQEQFVYKSEVRQSINSLNREQQIRKYMSNNTQSRVSKTRVAHSLVDLVNSDMDLNSNLGTSSDATIFNSPMHFGTANSTVIATQIGATAHIPCIVHHIGECLVSSI